MKWSRSRILVLFVLASSAFLVAMRGRRLLLDVHVQGAKLINYGTFHDWLENTETGSAVEAALYRLMALPTGDVLYPRPPEESRPELNKLLAAGTPEAALYSLRALQEEQAIWRKLSGTSFFARKSESIYLQSH